MHITVSKDFGGKKELDGKVYDILSFDNIIITSGNRAGMQRLPVWWVGKLLMKSITNFISKAEQETTAAALRYRIPVVV